MATIETIKHKIVSLDSTHGSIQVNYYTDLAPEGLTYQVDLSLNENGEVINGQPLTDLIIHFTPVEQLTYLEETIAFNENRRQMFAGKDFSAIPVEQKPSQNGAQPISTGAQTL
jgi:hypothetical protein